MQACSEFAQVERFEQIVVGTGLQAIDAISDRVPGSEDQNRQLQALMAQLLQQLEAILVRQPKVEHHHVELRHLEHRPGGGRRGDVFHGQALGGQAGDDTAGDQFIVFANQYVHGEPRRNKAY
ncbi:hypothetical protein D3C85_1445640 [compost metagenome]